MILIGYLFSFVIFTHAKNTVKLKRVHVSSTIFRFCKLHSVLDVAALVTAKQVYAYLFFVDFSLQLACAEDFTFVWNRSYKSLIISNQQLIVAVATVHRHKS